VIQSKLVASGIILTLSVTVAVGLIDSWLFGQSIQYKLVASSPQGSLRARGVMSPFGFSTLLARLASSGLGSVLPNGFVSLALCAVVISIVEAAVAFLLLVNLDRPSIRNLSLSVAGFLVFWSFFSVSHFASVRIERMPQLYDVPGPPFGPTVFKASLALTYDWVWALAVLVLTLALLSIRLFPSLAMQDRARLGSSGSLLATVVGIGLVLSSEPGQWMSAIIVGRLSLYLLPSGVITLIGLAFAGLGWKKYEAASNLEINQHSEWWLRNLSRVAIWLLVALLVLGVSYGSLTFARHRARPRNVTGFDRAALRDWLVDRQLPSGGFVGAQGMQNVVSSYYALASLELLNGTRYVDSEALARYVLSLREEDGSFASVVAMGRSSAKVISTSAGLMILSRLGKLQEAEVDRTFRWLVLQRQFVNASDAWWFMIRALEQQGATGLIDASRFSSLFLNSRRRVGDSPFRDIHVAWN